MVPDLRHTFATGMRRAGVPRTVTMSVTGHAIKDMNERYDTVEDWEKLEGVEKLRAYRNSVRHSVSFDPSKKNDNPLIPLHKDGGSAWESNPPNRF